MRIVYKIPVALVVCSLFWLGNTETGYAQFTSAWLDIGEYQHAYIESGARNETSSAPGGTNWPAIMRHSGHTNSRAFWIGVRNWTSEGGESFPYFVARIGPRGTPGIGTSFPIQNKIVSRFDDTEVLVDGALSFNNVAVVEDIDPSMSADRMVHNIHNMVVGVTVERKMYAFSNEHHDDYHLIEVTYTNTGNVDDDDEIELPNQTLEDVYFFRIHRWRGNEQEAWNTGNAQAWGKFNMIDVVGDGHADYPVDFTAVYIWPGYNPDFTNWNNLGGPLFSDSHWTVAEGDSTGRLSGGSFIGRAIIHADNSPTDNTYDPAQQPHTIGFIDSDEALTADGASHEDYYELGILTRERPSRMFPHYADRIEPSGEFWNPTGNASSGKQGGHAPTMAFGPYQMAPGESVRMVYVEGINGLNMPSRRAIGAAYKQSGGDDNMIIEYDANGDGTISREPFDHSTVGYDLATGPTYGTEAMTKNQWVLSARDSLFWMFEKGMRVWNNGRQIAAPPLPPRQFSVFGRPDGVDLTWEPLTGGPSVSGWEVYRTDRFSDNLPYEKVATLPAGATSYQDTDLQRGTDYFYYLQAVGEAQSVDPWAITGTPTGAALRSGRYYTQTYQPVNLKRPPGSTLEAARVVPNPVILASDGGGGDFDAIRFAREDEVAFFDIPGQSIIQIYTEIGELVHTIEHTDGSGDEKWNLTTTSRQLLVSGIYIAVIQDLDTGDRVFRKFTVIR